MSTTTKNYELIKPELTDVADITAMNPNWDKLDTELKNLSDHVDDLKDTAGAVELTQEEYDELSQEDKMKDVIYFITNNDDVGEEDEEEKEVEYVGSNPNLLINGDFQVNQRGATTYTGVNWSTKVYTVDRWFLLGSGTYKMSATVNENTVTINNPTPEKGYFRQAFEKPLSGIFTTTVNVINLSGKGYVYTDKGSVGELNQGKNIITFEDTTPFFAIVLEPSSSIEIEYIKLEQGSVATPFIPRLYAEELMLCKRFCRRFSAFDYIGSIGSTSIIYLRLPIEDMRVIPTISHDITNVTVVADGEFHTGSASSIICDSLYGIKLQVNGLTMTRRVGAVYWTGSQSIICDSEIY